MKIAHTIEVNVPKGRVIIDGITFPYYILENPEVILVPGNENISALQLQVLAHTLTVVGSDGTTSVISQASDAEEIAWGAQRAKEIVQEGLADIIRSFR